MITVIEGSTGDGLKAARAELQCLTDQEHRFFRVSESPAVVVMYDSSDRVGWIQFEPSGRFSGRYVFSTIDHRDTLASLDDALAWKIHVAR